jgi:hypothetical protein
MQKSVRFSQTDNKKKEYVPNSNTNYSNTALEIFNYILTNDVRNNLIESINNFKEDNVYVPSEIMNENKYGDKTIIIISENSRKEIIDRLKYIFSKSQYRDKNIDKLIKQTADNELLMRQNKFWNKVVNDILTHKFEPTISLFVDIMKPYLDTREENEYIIEVMLFLKLFFPNMSYVCKTLVSNENIIKQYIQYLLSRENQNVDAEKFWALFRDILYFTFGCRHTTSGGSAEKYKYKGRSYKVRMGVRGGKYILVSDKKIYVK